MIPRGVKYFNAGEFEKSSVHKSEKPPVLEDRIQVRRVECSNKNSRQGLASSAVYTNTSTHTHTVAVFTVDLACVVVLSLETTRQ